MVVAKKLGSYVLRLNFIPLVCIVHIHDIKLHHPSRSHFFFLVSLLVFVCGDVLVYSCTTSVNLRLVVVITGHVKLYHATVGYLQLADEL